ncbi:MAG: dihydroxy-acid dehydratase [Actinobacteria bacterium]|nr:dihydroxy-acid dehydratase [Actinomycetota bacterium]
MKIKRWGEEVAFGAECDALYFGMGWSKNDLNKPNIIIESVWGDSHPGSVHLNELVEHISFGVLESGGRHARYTVTDMCDGVCQGLLGMSYALLSREVIASMVEIHIAAAPIEGVVLVSSCDKSIPAHLCAAARINLPTILLPGGVMATAPNFLSTDKLWEYERKLVSGEIEYDEFLELQRFTCPSGGACQGMGTANTMQAMAEALGLALPWSAMAPASSVEIKRIARDTGKMVVELVKSGIKVSDIVTEESFKNAIAVHAAIGGSANAVIHLIAMAKEMGIELKAEVFDEINRRVPVIANVAPVGKYSPELFWYAGGIPKIMMEIVDFLNLNVLTVSGKTLGENLKEVEKSKYQINLANSYLMNFGLLPDDIIKSIKNPIYKEGGLAILKGNMCPCGSIVKHSSVVPEMMVHIGKARVFDDEDAAINSIINGLVKPGDIIIIRYQGPKAKGAPEMFRIADYISKRPELKTTTAIITDGRFSGFSKGPAIGYVTPEAYEGAYFGLVEDGDEIEINIPQRRVDIISVRTENNKNVRDIEEIMRERRKKWKKPIIELPEGILSLYQKCAGQLLLEGGRISMYK